MSSQGKKQAYLAECEKDNEKEDRRKNAGPSRTAKEDEEVEIIDVEEFDGVQFGQMNNPVPEDIGLVKALQEVRWHGKQKQSALVMEVIRSQANVEQLPVPKLGEPAALTAVRERRKKVERDNFLKAMAKENPTLFLWEDGSEKNEETDAAMKAAVNNLLEGCVGPSFAKEEVVMEVLLSRNRW